MYWFLLILPALVFKSWLLANYVCLVLAQTVWFYSFLFPFTLSNLSNIFGNIFVFFAGVINYDRIFQTLLYFSVSFYISFDLKLLYISLDFIQMFTRLPRIIAMIPALPFNEILFLRIFIYPTIQYLFNNIVLFWSATHPQYKYNIRIKFVSHIYLFDSSPTYLYVLPRNYTKSKVYKKGKLKDIISIKIGL